MKPRIFVSSTFYDLKFIREDLSNFIKAHDFEPIMFEDGDIGYTPGKELDLSCYETMKNADMVLLIIGGEYGSPATGEKEDKFEEYISITRNEFRAAAKAGIPIFVFIESNVYTEYGVYEINLDKIENKGLSIEFKATKNINVFRFVKEIRTLSDKPIQEFRRSADIKSFLSKQWSDMFKNYLALLRSNEENATLQNTVADMETLIKQMSIMLDAVGKKVIGDNDTIQYNNILQQQNEVEARRLCKLISNGVIVTPPQLDDRAKNVSFLLNILKDTLKCTKEESLGEEHEEDFRDKLANILVSKMIDSSYFIHMISGTLLKSIPDIVKALENEDVEQIVQRRLTFSSYYRKIFESPTQVTSEDFSK